MKDILAIIGIVAGVLLLITMAIYMSAVIFAAPGYIVLLIIGHSDIGFWNSAAAGYGTVILTGLVATLVYGRD